MIYAARSSNCALTEAYKELTCGPEATAENGQYGVAWKYPIKDQAEKAAMNECGKHGSNCELRISFRDCGAVARSEDGALG